MFFNSAKSCEVKKYKHDKHMELGLYRHPIINFQGPKSKGTSRRMYVEILICSKMLEKFNFSDIFFTHVIHFSGELCFLSTSQLSFAPEQLSTLSTVNELSTDLFNSNNRLSVFSRPLEGSVKDKHFQSTSVFLPSCTSKCHSSTTMHIAKIVHFMRNRLEGNF